MALKQENLPCRCFLAAGYGRQVFFTSSNARGMVVTSVGIEAVRNQEAYLLAKRMSQQYEVGLDAHRTTLVSQELVSNADMTPVDFSRWYSIIASACDGLLAQTVKRAADSVVSYGL